MTERYINPSINELKEIIANGQKPMMFYHLSKDEIVNKDLSGVDKTMRTAQAVGKGVRQCVIITCGGYDDIPDELFEIPEVRIFVKHMFDKYPHILYYINSEFEAEHWLLTSLVDVQALRSDEQLNAHELVAKYGYFNIPKFQTLLTFEGDYFVKLLKAIIGHGKRNKDAKGGKRVAIEYAIRFDHAKDTLARLKIGEDDLRELGFIK
jgi:hypothetical protein